MVREMQCCLLWRRRKQAMSQEMWSASRSSKRKGNELSSRAICQKGTQPHWHLDFGLVRPALDFWSTELWENEFMLFWASKFLVICYSSNRKLIHIRKYHHLNLKCSDYVKEYFHKFSMLLLAHSLFSHHS